MNCLILASRIWVPPPPKSLLLHVKTQNQRGTNKQHKALVPIELLKPWQFHTPFPRSTRRRELCNTSL